MAEILRQVGEFPNRKPFRSLPALLREHGRDTDRKAHPLQNSKAFFRAGKLIVPERIHTYSNHG